jgi:hypothetical protein
MRIASSGPIKGEGLDDPDQLEILAEIRFFAQAIW